MNLNFKPAKPKDAYQTPAYVYKALNDEFGFDNRTDTEWFAQLYYSGAELRFWRKRLKFERRDNDILRSGTRPRAAIPVDGIIVAIIRRLGA
jgi:hypothetical protein